MVVEERKIIVPVMNGNVLTPAQSKPHRPDIKCATIEGLYFIGDTVKGDGCSGDISFSSAMKATDKILEELAAVLKKFPMPKIDRFNFNS